MARKKPEIDPAEAKATIFEYCKRKGALAVGVADLETVERICPPGYRPTDIMPRVKSVIAVGVGGQTQGAWSVPAKAMGYFGSTEGRAYTIAYGLSFMLESKFGMRSIYCPPDMDPDAGPRVPLQSLKVHAEIAGIGARSLAGDILLHPEFGYMYFASVFTELALEPDQPMETNPCPAPSCVNMYKQIGRTPCMKFCPVQCLDGEVDVETGEQKVMRYDMAACAEMTQQFETVPSVIMKAINATDSQDREDALFDPDNKMLWYKMSVGSGGLLAQCFECMRVCPIATKAPYADPILRYEAKQEAEEAARAEAGKDAPGKDATQ
jgi:epoxyqueuosine reductase QueG